MPLHHRNLQEIESLLVDLHKSAPDINVGTKPDTSNVQELEGMLAEIGHESHLNPDHLGELDKMMQEALLLRSNKGGSSNNIDTRGRLQNSKVAHQPISNITPVVNGSGRTAVKTPKKIFVIGHPSRLGGADTELDQQIRIWQKLGLQVHIIHTGYIDANLKAMRMAERGCIIHKPRDWYKCKGEVVISYCNDQFLKNIEDIHHYARKVLWVNCMPWLFEDEKKAHAKGYIDYFLYQTDHARLRVQDELASINPEFKWRKVRPYFHCEDFPFVKDRPENTFRFGRVSRADAGKFSERTLWLYETMVAPVAKSGLILGINEAVRKKIGNPPDWIKCYDAGELTTQEAYRFIETFISMNGNYENLPRVAFEAMASGSLLIVDNNGGWKEQVEHGKTGWLCSNDREFAYYASRSAFEYRERKQMIANAYDWLSTNWGEQKAMVEWKNFFEEVYA